MNIKNTFRRLRRSITACNDQALLALVAVANELQLSAPAEAGADASVWMRVAKFGNYPQRIVYNDGSTRDIIQVVDRQGAEEMVDRFRSMINVLAHLRRGLPVYEGHPDDPVWRAANAGAQQVARGRVKELQVREDGPWMRVAFEPALANALRSDTPPFSAHSPRWNMLPMEGKPDHFRVVQLLSVGLTNDPNLSDNAIAINAAPPAAAPSRDLPTEAAPEPKPKTNMDKAILQRLGLAAEATDEQIATAINAALDERDTAKTDLTAANQRATDAQAAADQAMTAAINTALDDAVQTGRITTAARPKWEAALKVDFDSESAKLKTLMPAVNTANKVADVANRRGEGSEALSPAPNPIEAINCEVRAFAREHGLDLSNTDQYAQAHNAVRAAKPELFDAKAG